MCQQGAKRPPWVTPMQPPLSMNITYIRDKRKYTLSMRLLRDCIIVCLTRLLPCNANALKQADLSLLVSSTYLRGKHKHLSKQLLVYSSSVHTCGVGISLHVFTIKIYTSRCGHRREECLDGN